MPQGQNGNVLLGGLLLAAVFALLNPGVFQAGLRAAGFSRNRLPAVLPRVVLHFNFFRMFGLVRAALLARPLGNGLYALRRAGGLFGDGFRAALPVVGQHLNGFGLFHRLFVLAVLALRGLGGAVPAGLYQRFRPLPLTGGGVSLPHNIFGGSPLMLASSGLWRIRFYGSLRSAQLTNFQSFLIAVFAAGGLLLEGLLLKGVPVRINRQGFGALNNPRSAVRALLVGGFYPCRFARGLLGDLRLRRPLVVSWIRPIFPLRSCTGTAGILALVGFHDFVALAGLVVRRVFRLRHKRIIV